MVTGSSIARYGADTLAMFVHEVEDRHEAFDLFGGLPAFAGEDVSPPAIAAAIERFAAHVDHRFGNDLAVLQGVVVDDAASAGFERALERLAAERPP